MMNKATLSKYRAKVIERFINVEWIINVIISQHYFKRVALPFILEVLYDEYFSFALKRRILEKIIDNINNQKVQDLNRLNTIRNYFAHCDQEIIKVLDTEIRGGKIIDKVRGKTVDPRNIEREINFEELYAEFMRIVGGVEEYLVEIYKDLGGKFITEPPVSP
jgi:hypothetical protein